MSLLATGAMGMERGHCELRGGGQRQVPVPQAALPDEPAPQKSPPVGVVEPVVVLSGVFKKGYHWRLNHHCMLVRFGCFRSWGSPDTFQWPLKLALPRHPAQGVECSYEPLSATIQK